MSLHRRYWPAGCQSGPSVNRQPDARRSNSIVAPTTWVKRACRTGRRSLLGPALAGLAAHVPVGRVDLLEHHPDGFLGQLGDVGDRGGHPLGDLVLTLLAPALVDAAAHAWHRSLRWPRRGGGRYDAPRRMRGA